MDRPSIQHRTGSGPNTQWKRFKRSVCQHTAREVWIVSASLPVATGAAGRFPHAGSGNRRGHTGHRSAPYYLDGNRGSGTGVGARASGNHARFPDPSNTGFTPYTPNRVLKKICQRASRIAQRLNVPKRTPCILELWDMRRMERDRSIRLRSEETVPVSGVN